jgi:DNA repair ATPase RecN
VRCPSDYNTHRDRGKSADQGKVEEMTDYELSMLEDRLNRLEQRIEKLGITVLGLMESIQNIEMQMETLTVAEDDDHN